MNPLFSMILLLALVPQNQKLPDAFPQVPEELRQKGTVIVTGTYGQGRSPCIFRPDGTRIWALEPYLNVKKVYRGKVGGKSIQLNHSEAPNIDGVSVKLEVGQDYLVLLRPNAESMKVIEAGRYVAVWNALHADEIVAIVKIK